MRSSPITSSQILQTVSQTQTGSRLITTSKQPFQKVLNSNTIVTNTETVATENKVQKEIEVIIDPNKQSAEQRIVALPPVTLSTMKAKKLCYEIEVDDALAVTGIEKVKLSNGKTKYSFSISKPEVKTEILEKINKRRAPTQKLDGTVEVQEEDVKPEEERVMKVRRKMGESKIVTKQESSDEEMEDPEEEEMEDPEELGLDEPAEVEEEEEEGFKVDPDEDGDEEDETGKGTSTQDLEYGDEDDDFREEVENSQEVRMPKRAKTKNASSTPKRSTKVEQTDGDDTPKRIYIKTNAYAKNEHYRLIKEEGIYYISLLFFSYEC